MPGRILVDVSPLTESRQFRLLFTGQVIGTLGTQLTVVAIPFQVYDQTHSSLQVGAVSLAQLGPLIVGALLGGAVGDAVDGRRLLLVSSLALALTSLGLSLNAAAGRPSILAIYLVSAAAAGFTGFANTIRNAAVPSLVGPRLLVPAYAFLQITFQVGSVAGPALAGVLIGAIHLQWVYGIDAATYLATTVTVLAMAAIPPAGGPNRRGLGSLAEGIRYLRGHQALQGVYLIDINAMVFGMPRALFPALAAGPLGGGATTLGLLYAAPGAGALVGAATTGWVSAVRRQGAVVIGAVVVWGAAIAAFGFSRTLWVSLALLAVAGWADVISAVLRNTMLQSSIPAAFRSRMSAIQMAVVQGGPRLGDLESGAVAAAVGTELSIVSGGLACIAGAAVLSAALPAFRHYRAGTPVRPAGPPAAELQGGEERPGGGEPRGGAAADGRRAGGAPSTRDPER